MKYTYKPKTFYAVTLLCTWVLWFAAAFCHDFSVSMGLMFLGLIVPSVVAFLFVTKSGSAALQKDYKEKVFGFFRVNIGLVLSGILVFMVLIAVSILLSLVFGESPDQFSLADGFSFSIGGIPTLFVLVLTALFEELGWRGYAEDSIAQYHSWFMESIIFGFLWAIWHLPLFFIPGTYQAVIFAMSPWYMINFFVGIIPLGFFFTWMYVGSNRSIFACSLVHFAVNFLQEEINMTQNTKCIETVLLFVLAAILVVTNRDLFFEKRHINNMLGE